MRPDNSGQGGWRCLVAAHDREPDFCMLLGSIFLLIVGAGAWSIDTKLAGQAE